MSRECIAGPTAVVPVMPRHLTVFAIAPLSYGLVNAADSLAANSTIGMAKFWMKLVLW